jgi:antitoxin component of MazEF toxin-antitoxin module
MASAGAKGATNMTKRVWRTGNSLVVSITKEEAERLDIHEGDFVNVQFQKMELRPAMRPEVKAALERAAARLAPDLEYLKDK